MGQISQENFRVVSIKHAIEAINCMTFSKSLYISPISNSEHPHIFNGGQLSSLESLHMFSSRKCIDNVGNCSINCIWQFDIRFLGGITESLCEYMKNIPRLIMQKQLSIVQQQKGFLNQKQFASGLYVFHPDQR